MYCKEQFEEIKNSIVQKGQKSEVVTLVSLIDKLSEKGIEDEALDKMFEELYSLLSEYNAGEQDKHKKREIKKHYSLIIKHVETNYKMVQKGSLSSTYMALYMCIGVAISTAFSSTNPALMAIGIPIGFSFGLLLGSAMEKKADKEGRLY